MSSIPIRILINGNLQESGMSQGLGKIQEIEYDYSSHSNTVEFRVKSEDPIKGDLIDQLIRVIMNHGIPDDAYCRVIDSVRNIELAKIDSCDIAVS